jgi:hypothetical protein
VEELLGVAQVAGEDVMVVPHTVTRKIHCFIPHELELVQAVQVGENLLGVAQVVGEDVMVAPHTLSQRKFIVLSLMSLSSFRQSRWGKKNLLGMAQVVGENVVIVPHTLCSTDAVQSLQKAFGPVLI